MIIDAHSHVGDCAYPSGGKQIFEKGRKKQPSVDLFSFAEWRLYGSDPVSDWFAKTILAKMVIRSLHIRNRYSTLENMRLSLDSVGVDKTVCLPIAPYVTFEDLLLAQKKDPAVIPFTTVDFSSDDFELKLQDDIERGAKGLKLHPILQSEALDSENTFRAVEAFAPSGLPILFHSGETGYYLPGPNWRDHQPQYGDPKYGATLARAFPKVTFIGGHAGLMQTEKALQLWSDIPNLHVDISFQSPKMIRKLLDSFGPKRVLFGSDWPYGSRDVSIRALKMACRGDKSVEKMLLGENAAELLRL